MIQAFAQQMLIATLEIIIALLWVMAGIIAIPEVIFSAIMAFAAVRQEIRLLPALAANGWLAAETTSRQNHLII